jgi:putative nucleotidyltransferase with HDIG domain
LSRSDEIEEALERVPTPADEALGMLQVVSDAPASADEVLAALRGEPELRRRILALSNSSLHDLPCEITDVSQTIAYLGTGTLIRMVVTLSALPLFEQGRPGAATWVHSVACGIAAQLLADSKGTVDPACAFAAGMLHDIGELPLAPFVEAECDDLAEATEVCRHGFAEAEHLVLGIDHAAAGAKLAERWRLPLNLRLAIRHHHDPKCVAPADELTCLVHVADVLAMQLGAGLGPEGISYRVCDDAVRRLHLAPQELDFTRVQLIEELQRSADLLELGRGDRPAPLDHDRSRRSA